jgi:6-phosphofructokinase 1
MNVAIMCSGGDCSGMNPAIKRFIEYSLEKNKTPYLIYNGLEGMIEGKIKKASLKEASGIIFRGGTVIGSSRSKRFYEYRYRKKAYEELKKRGIERVVVLGGDGSFKAMKIFYDEFGMPFSGVPATIDNDIALNSYSLGVDTALNIIRRAIDEIRDTASSFKRGFVIETMGRGCGYLAAVSALAGGAEICLIPEVRYSLDSIKKRLQKEFSEGRGYCLAVVSEALDISVKLKEWMQECFDIETRVTVLGHTQRGGNPTVYDRLMAYEFTTYALECEEKEAIIVYDNGRFETKKATCVIESKYQMDAKILDFVKRLSGVVRH